MPMLDKVATHYENEVDNAVDGLTYAMMEPVDYGSLRCFSWWSSYCHVPTNLSKWVQIVRL